MPPPLVDLAAVVTLPDTPPFPVPDLAGLSGFQCYGQALVFDPVTLQFANSNPLAIGIGR